MVISIIALLIAIMLPALGAARESARSISCASNIRQVGVGIAMYNADNKGWNPVKIRDRVTDEGAFPSNGQHFPWHLRDYLNIHWTSNSSSQWAGMSGETLWQCPSGLNNTEGGYGGHAHAGYASRGYGGVWLRFYFDRLENHNFDPANRFADATVNASQQLLLADIWTGEDNYGSRFAEGFLHTDRRDRPGGAIFRHNWRREYKGFRHNNENLNVLFADMHVASRGRVASGQDIIAGVRYGNDFDLTE